MTDQISAPQNSASLELVKGAFSLVDHDGNAVTLDTYRGRHLLLFFGFTNCKVVCPRNLSRIEAALRRLGALAGEIQALYVTVDPARDSPSVLKSFVEQRYPHFTGLSGSSEQIEAVKRTYRVFARRKEDPCDPRGYTMPHTAFTYLIAPTGEYVAHFTDDLDAEQLALRLRAHITADTSGSEGGVSHAGA